MMMKEKLDRIVQERKQQQNNNPLIFWEHINILKKYLFIICFFVILFSSIAFFYNVQILKFLTKPLNGIDLIFLSPIDPMNFIIFETFLTIFIFQVPLIIILLIYFGICKSQTISSKRRYIYLFSIIILSVITPTTDIISLLILLIPTGLLFAKLIPPRVNI